MRITVFGAAGSDINHAHIALLVDFMTFTGDIISIDRHGLNKLDSEPMSKASFEKSFGFAASKRRGRPFLHKLEKLHDDRYYANKVIEARLRNYFKGTQISLTTAFTDTSFNEKVSYESVKNAWGKHRNFYKSMLRRLKVPEKLG